MYNMSGHLPLLLVNPLNAQLAKTFFQHYWWSHNWQGPFNVNMVVAILILIYMTSILLAFVVSIHQISTFLLRERDITPRHPFSFHDAKNISYVLLCAYFPLLNRFICFLAHLSRRLKWAIFLARRPSSVRPSVRRRPSLSVVVVRKLSHFQLLLMNRMIDFDETWYGCSTHGPLQVLLFFG